MYMKVIKKSLPISIVILLFFTIFITSAQAESIILKEDFEEYSVGSTPSAWFPQRNYQWNNPTGKCMEGSSPAKWIVENYAGSNRVKIRINGPGCQMEISPTNFSIPDTSNYQYDLDMTFAGPINRDRNIVFRFVKGDQWYGMKLMHSTNIQFVKILPPAADNLGVAYFSKGFTENKTYHFTIKTVENLIQLYIDNELIYQVQDQEPTLKEGTIALQASLGTLGETITYFDNIVVTDLSQPKINLLPIPFFSQLDPQWANTTYDSADKWSKVGYQGIKDYGCALTSAAMILSYRGFPTNPESLNTYLKENGGYSDYGFLNWPALSKFTKLSKDGGTASPSAIPVDFEYSTYSKDSLIADLEASQPGIIRVVTNAHDTTTTNDDDTHFVVYKGWDKDNNIFLSDPLSVTDDNPNLEEKYAGKGYSKIGHFVNTKDPSYIWMYLNDKNGQITVEKDGVAVGQKELELISTGASESGILPSWLYTIQRPEKGTYTITLSSSENKIVPLEMYLFDNQAKEKSMKPKIVVGPSNSRTISLTFDPANVDATNIKANSTFATLRTTLRYILSSNKALKRYVPAYIQLVDYAEKMSTRYAWITKESLQTLEWQMNSLKKFRVISGENYQLVHDEIDRIMVDYQDAKPCWYHPFFPHHKPCQHR